MTDSIRREVTMESHDGDAVSDERSAQAGPHVAESGSSVRAAGAAAAAVPAQSADPVQSAQATVPAQVTQAPDASEPGQDTGSEAVAESAESTQGADPAPPRAPARQVDRFGLRRPRSAAGWALYPFAVCWRLMFPKKPRPFIVELPFLVVFALVLAFVIKTFLVQAFFIPSGSMQNTLAIGDRVLVNRAEVWLGDQPARGEVVVFRDPGDWLGDEGESTSTNWFTSVLTYVGVLPQNDGDLIKRVIGVGGDHVVCCNAQNQITVNGVPLNESGYLYPGDSSDSAPGGVNPRFDVVVPQGYLWVMGDHRSVSEDSRAHVVTGTQFVPVSDVVGKADVVIWPASQWATLPVPATFRQAGLNALSAPGGTPIAALAVALPATALRRRRKLRKHRLRAENDEAATTES